MRGGGGGKSRLRAVGGGSPTTHPHPAEVVGSPMAHPIGQESVGPRTLNLRVIPLLPPLGFFYLF